VVPETTHTHTPRKVFEMLRVGVPKATFVKVNQNFPRGGGREGGGG